MDYNFITACLAIITILVAIISMYVSITQSAIAQSMANDANVMAKNANDIANRALNIAAFEHKKSIKPNLFAALHDSKIAEYTYRAPLVMFTNSNPGKASIDKIWGTDVSLLEMDDTEVKPKELLENGVAKYQVKIIPGSFLNRNGISIESASVELLKTFIEDVYFIIIYTDKIETKYRVILVYDPTTETWKGTPQEIAPSPLLD